MKKKLCVVYVTMRIRLIDEKF